MRRLFAAFILAVLGAASRDSFSRAAAPSPAAPGPSPRADRVFVNGRVWTADPRRPRAEAVALAGERILAVGSNAEIERLAGPATVRVDLHGRFVAPGFNDAHLHFLVVDTVDLADATSLADIQRRIREYAEAHTDLPWVAGRGWTYGAFPGGLPDRRQLDAAVPDRPAFMTGYDGHTAWANSKALALAGITRETPDPEHGAIVRDAAGEPTGALKESAAALVRRLVPPPSDAQRHAALLKRLDEAASYGLTSVQNASYPAADIPTYERVLAEGGLKVRVYMALPMVKDISAAELARYQALRAQYPGPLFKYGAVKGFVDGVVESKTAAMLEPYVGGGRGELNWTPEDLDRTVALYDREGFQIFLHAIGDRAIRTALDAYERAARSNGTSGRRHRVEHIEVPTREDIARFARLGVIASTQALFANPDQNSLDVYVVNIGPDRASRAMAFRSLDESGAVQAFGSDSPVFSMEVLRGIYCAVTRMTPEGTPPGGWEPQERISAEAALRHFTRDAAYASFEDQRKGTLAPGMLADLVVLSDDILSVPPERILKTRVLLTVMGGRDTYRGGEP
jgi:predicted amidohydrolase YtcJ